MNNGQNDKTIKTHRGKGFKNKKSKTKIIIYIIMLILFCCVLNHIIHPNKNITIFGLSTYVVGSGSMQPELNIGDMIIVQEIKESDLKIGDIVTFASGNTVVTHRVIDIKKEDGIIKYKTKGDYNNVEDADLICYSDIRGKVIGKIPFSRKIDFNKKRKILKYLDE